MEKDGDNMNLMKENLVDNHIWRVRIMLLVEMIMMDPMGNTCLNMKVCGLAVTTISL